MIVSMFLWPAAVALADDELTIQIQHGYGTTQNFVVEGRVVEKRTGRAPRSDDSRLRNLWRNLRQLVNDEQDKVPLRVKFSGQTFETRTDREGNFSVRAATPAAATPGWSPAEVGTPDGELAARAGVLIVPPGNRLGVISDFDDTLIVSNVNDKSKLLRLSLMKNPVQRQVSPGMPAFLRALAARNPLPPAAPVFYLSASPRQLQASIQSFLDRNGYPRGVLLAKKVTDDKTSDPLTDQVRYKTARIEALLRELPALRFVLIGDDGEKDPEIYHDIRTRFPARVEAVYIRRVHPDPDRRRYPEQRPAPPATPGS
ncbi:MAG: hypothetical protein A2140_03430 [Candidatus Muproteobacteria bacterium RBG_16_62_13]|uniref:Phosphatidate phosphatase APP1 catalytic domain-containing protein n=1 Tax=Candidatus Muproteobacteria bacterium RBG_16_62_13 TaxID=1817756 RepID=A0A1F6T7C6_9PROT|nr:MAG: hypothetical protein A2140_03430 [Candidatus Muproteobacteria bacterium RBG_16_62_13]